MLICPKRQVLQFRSQNRSDIAECSLPLNNYLNMLEFLCWSHFNLTKCVIEIDKILGM